MELKWWSRDPAAMRTEMRSWQRDTRQRLRSLLAHHATSLSPAESALASEIGRQNHKMLQALADAVTHGQSMVAQRTILIKPVGDGCNYRCDYCFHHDVLEHLDRLPIQRLELIYKNVQHAVGNNVTFCWHGGEPTLAGIEWFFEAMRLQEQVFGSRPDNVIQTNGSTINPRWVDFFRTFEFSVGVSLDGTAEKNDRHRINIGGQGTFARTVTAMQRLRDGGVPFGVIAVVTKDADARGLYQCLHEAGADSLSTNPATAPADLAPTAAEYGRFVTSLIGEWLASGGQRPTIRHATDALAGMIGSLQSTCYLRGTCSQFLTVQNDGLVKGCCDRNTDPVTHPETYFGNVLDEDLAAMLAGPRFQAFAATVDENPATCDGCRWQPICKGGCSHQRLIQRGSLRAHDPYCETYKAIFSYMQSVLNEIPMPDTATSTQLIESGATQ
jgi:uncharacterized protein